VPDVKFSDKLQYAFRVASFAGLQCSVGVSGDKTTAKFAAKLVKPNGFTVIPPWEARERLRNVPLTDLCGIKNGIGGFLALRGILLRTPHLHGEPGYCES